MHCVSEKAEARHHAISSGKGPQKMNFMATTTNLPHTTACGEPIGLFHSSGEVIPPAAERDPAKDLALPGRRDAFAHVVNQ
jgi:hypothetical protein